MSNSEWVFLRHFVPGDQHKFPYEDNNVILGRTEKSGNIVQITSPFISRRLWRWHVQIQHKYVQRNQKPVLLVRPVCHCCTVDPSVRRYTGTVNMIGTHIKHDHIQSDVQLPIHQPRVHSDQRSFSWLQATKSEVTFENKNKSEYKCISGPKLSHSSVSNNNNVDSYELKHAQELLQQVSFNLLKMEKNPQSSHQTPPKNTIHHSNQRHLEWIRHTMYWIGNNQPKINVPPQTRQLWIRITMQ